MLGVAGVVHSCTVANEQGVNYNNITNMVELADHVQRHGDGDTQEHQEKAGHMDLVIVVDSDSHEMVA